MPVTPYMLTYDISSLPQQLQVFVGDIDAALQAPWDPQKHTREIEFLWSAYGGHSATKERIVRDVVVVLYQSLGWKQVTIHRHPNRTNQTKMTMIFER